MSNQGLSNIVPVTNVGRNEGEFNVRFVTDDNLRISTRQVAVRQVEPILGPFEGLFKDFGNMFEVSCLDELVINETGKSPKLTFVANATYEVKFSENNQNVPELHVFKRRIYIETSVPSEASLTLLEGVPTRYGNPAVSEAEFMTQGGFNDRAQQINFYNSKFMSSGCFMTAAAYQMAIDYIRYFMLPKLHGGVEGFEIDAIDGASYRDEPKPEMTNFMPGELVKRHKQSVLSVIYRALEAKEVLAYVGIDTNDITTFNKCGDLAECVVTENDWFEAWHVLRHSATGSSDGRNWDLDFIYPFIQNFPLHGISDEGGVWRELFLGAFVRPNKSVIVSKFASEVQGYANFNEKDLLGTAITIQSIVGRAISETRINKEKFMLEPSASNDRVRAVISMMLDEVKEALVTTCGSTIEYWNNLIGNRLLINVAGNRHVNKFHANYFGASFPYAPSYSVNALGDRLGSYTYDRMGVEPLVFRGEYSTTRLEVDNEIRFVYDLGREMKFSDGLFYVNPKINPEDGLWEMKNDGVYTGSNQPLSSYSRLVDGRVFKRGDQMSDIAWADNGDFIPTGGEFLSRDQDLVQLTPAFVPEWVTRGNYTVRISRYYLTKKQKGESGTNTRRTILDRKIGKIYDDIEWKDRPKFHDIGQYLRDWKNMGSRKLEHEVRMSKKRETRAMEQIGYEGINPDNHTISRLVCGYEEILKPRIEAMMILRKDVEIVRASDDFTKLEHMKQRMIKNKIKTHTSHDFTFIDKDDLVDEEKNSDETDKRKTRIRWGSSARTREFKKKEYLRELSNWMVKVVAEVKSEEDSFSTILASIGGRENAELFENSIAKFKHSQATFLTTKRDDGYIEDRPIKPANIPNISQLGSTRVPERVRQSVNLPSGLDHVTMSNSERDELLSSINNERLSNQQATQAIDQVQRGVDQPEVAKLTESNSVMLTFQEFSNLVTREVAKQDNIYGTITEVQDNLLKESYDEMLKNTTFLVNEDNKKQVLNSYVADTLLMPSIRLFKRPAVEFINRQVEMGLTIEEANAIRRQMQQDFDRLKLAKSTEHDATQLQEAHEQTAENITNVEVFDDPQQEFEDAPEVAEQVDNIAPQNVNATSEQP